MVIESRESDLVAAILGGDKSCFVQLVRLHESAARAVAYSVTQSADLMEDVLQESYLKAYRSLGTYKSSEPFRPWLCRIIRNTAIDELRRRKVVVMHPTDDIDSIAGVSSDQSEVSIQRMDVRTALNSMTEQQRTAIVLIDAEQCSYEEASRILNVPQGTVATRV